MVRVTSAGHFINGVQYVEFAGLSTDVKPDGDFLTGSSFLEVDTTKVYFFDEESGTWLEVGGGGD